MVQRASNAECSIPNRYTWRERGKRGLAAVDLCSRARHSVALVRLAIVQKLFFHLHEGDAVLIDEEGADLESLHDARIRALQDARSIMSSEVAAGKLCLSCYIRVEDAQGSTLMTVTFREALEVTGL